MGRNFYKLWVTLLVISGGIALWFSALAASGFWAYARLSGFTTARINSWDIHAFSPSCFALVAHYSYEVGGSPLVGKTIFENLRFPNQFAAENYIETIASKQWAKSIEVWYSKRNPAFSSLEREFPQKQSLQALLTIGVFAYFYFSRTMLSRAIGAA